MRNARGHLRVGLIVLLAVSAVLGQDRSVELERGQKLVERSASQPVKTQATFAEMIVNDQVVGYTVIRVEPREKDVLRTTVDVVMQMPLVQLSGAVTAETDLKLRPRRVELRRAVRQPDGQSVSQQHTLQARDGQLELTMAQGDQRQTQKKPLPKERCFFSVDLLVARAAVGQATEPFALHELNPQTGEPRLLVFRPSVQDDGTRVVKIFVGGERLEGTYRFDKAGKLVSWSEEGAPVVVKVVDEARGQELVKKFGRPMGATTATAPRE